MREPSDKQIEAAKIISNNLHILLPKEFSAQAYWEFINENIATFRRVNAQRRLRRKNLDYEEAMDIWMDF